MNQTRIIITPQSFGVPQRIEAVDKARSLNAGVLMELHSSHTEYYADTDVPVGKVEIWAPNEYKGFPEYVTTLDHPTDFYDPWASSAEKSEK